MRTDDFDFFLPEELIAQTPIQPRDRARLLVYNRADKSVRHMRVYDLPQFLGPGDALVVNDTRVLPARLTGEKADTGGRMEFLLLKRLDYNRWEVLVKPGRRARTGAEFIFGDCLKARVEGETEAGGRVVAFSFNGVFEQILDRLGQMPLPPYIHQQLEDKERYQTVYAEHPGSAAAPTAGLHFTPELLERIESSGASLVRLLLHVGLGTFRPVSVEDISRHKMHAEYYEVSENAADTLNAVRRAGGRIVAVGTTSSRTLETVTDENGAVRAQSGWTDIFISPGYTFKAVDALLTNFHLPKSTLIMLVSALMGREEALRIYRIAVEERYRFFSFGDAMLVL